MTRRYPLGPGYASNSATSRAAAAKAEKTLNALHMLVLVTFRKHGPMTADACAELLGMEFNVLRVRPRCTELLKPEYGALLERTGDTRPSALGNPQDVLRLTKAGHDALRDRSGAFHPSTVAPSVAQTLATQADLFGGAQ